jgi:hypothetical protein
MKKGFPHCPDLFSYLSFAPKDSFEKKLSVYTLIVSIMSAKMFLKSQINKVSIPHIRYGLYAIKVILLTPF